MKHVDIIKQLTLDEKCRLLVGKDQWHTFAIDRLQIPSRMMADGPHGLRKQRIDQEGLFGMESEPAVCYPTAATLASSFDKDLLKKVGQSIAKECHANGVSAILGPGLNIKRSPLCGRNFEYFSEDPLLAGELAKAFIQGVEEEGICATPKHYAMNNQEKYRMVASSEVDERAKREIYLRNFEIALQAKPGMLMSSYNRVDGIYASENVSLQRDTLRHVFGYEGVVVSDWTAVSNRVNALKASLDLEMPGHLDAVMQLKNGVKKNLISLEEIDQSVDRMLTFIFKYQPSYIPFNIQSGREIAKQALIESAVLLKNEGCLPFSKNENFTIIGALAKNPRYQGSGSSRVHPHQMEDFTALHPEICYAPGYDLQNDQANEQLIQEALDQAKNAKTILLFLGLTDLYESESYDRDHLFLPPGQISLLEELAKLKQPIVVILEGGSPIVMPWIDKVQAILHLYLGGECLYTGLNDLLFGRACPSGRLAESYFLSLNDHPTHPDFGKSNHSVYYQESIYVGYRYTTSKNLPVLFPFGFGLSYANIRYQEFSCESEAFYPGSYFLVKTRISNDSDFVAKEVVLLFVENPEAEVFFAKRELRQFQKVTIPPHSSIDVEFTITNQDFAFYNTQIKEYDILSGTYQIQIAKDAHTVLFQKLIQVKTRHQNENHRFPITPSSYQWSSLRFDEGDFRQLMQKNLPPKSMIYQRPFCLDHTLADIRHTFFGKMMEKQVLKMIQKQNQTNDPLVSEMIYRSLQETPLRCMAVYSDGLIRRYHIQALLDVINRRLLKAIVTLWRRQP